MLSLRPALTSGRRQRRSAAVTARLRRASIIPIACALARRIDADVGDRAAKVAQDLELSLGDALLRGEHDRFLFFQLWCEVALGAGQRLLANVVRRKRQPQFALLTSM